MSSIDILRTDVAGLQVDAIIRMVSVGDRIQITRNGLLPGVPLKDGECCLQEDSSLGEPEDASGSGGPPASRVILTRLPFWTSGRSGERPLLGQCFHRALTLAQEKEFHSIGIPVPTSLGIPEQPFWRIAIRACHSWLLARQDYNLRVLFAVPDRNLWEAGQRELIARFETARKQGTGSAPQTELEPGRFSLRTEETLTHILRKTSGSVTPDNQSVCGALLTDLKAGKYVMVPVQPRLMISARNEWQNPSLFGLTLKDLYRNPLAEADSRQNCIVAWTSEDRLDRTIRFVMPFPLLDLLKLFQEGDAPEGILFNRRAPAGLPGPDSGFFLSAGKARELLSQGNVLPADLSDRLLGDEAWRNGETKAAEEYYTRAANACNAGAYTRLGDLCWQSGGEGTPDRERSILCWTKAALLGDAQAMSRLADRYARTGSPEDLAFARALGWRAWNMVKGADDDARYADVYLLLLRHCPEELSDQFYLYLARKAVKGFRERLEEGDLRAKHLLDEATNLLQAIQNDLDEDPAE